MKSKLQNGNYFLNKDFAFYHRPQIPVTIQSKSALEIKSIPQPQPTNLQKKQKTIHYYDQYKFEQYTSAKTKLYDLLSLRQTNRTPIQRRRQPESSLIVKRSPEIFTSIVEINDIKQKVKTVSQECPRTQQKITMVQHSSQLVSTQKRNHNHSKSTNNNNTSTPILNKTVSQFQCFTPLTNQKNNAQSDLIQRIKQQKLESLINLIINNQLNNIVNGFTLIKNTAPLLPYFKELERRKAEFKQKKFQIKLIRIK